MNVSFGMVAKTMVVGIVALFFMAVLLGFIAAFPMMWCWNKVAIVFHLGQMTYWQAWCFLLIIAIIRGWSFKAEASKKS